MLKQGIHFDMPSADYFADPCPEPSLTQSIAKVLLAQSPGHARLEHPRLNPQPPQPEEYAAALAIGNAAHALMCGRGKDVVILEHDNFRTKAAQEQRDEISASGKTPILAKHHARAKAMVYAARNQLDAAGWIDAFYKGRGEVVLAWQEEGIWLRTMVDWIELAGHASDYKTTGMSVAPQNIGRLAVDAGWDVQAAMHERALNALEPKLAGRRRFRFIAQENFEPYALVPVELSEHWLTMGRKKLEFAISIWRRCIDNDEWPLYPSEPITPEYPGWQEQQWLNREIAESERLPADGIMAG